MFEHPGGWQQLSKQSLRYPYYRSDAGTGKMGYHNYKIIEALPGERVLNYPNDRSQSVSHTFVSLLLRTVAFDTGDYLTRPEIVERFKHGDKMGMNPEMIPRYWFGSWQNLAYVMWEKPDEATRSRIRRAWRALAKMGLAKRYCRRTRNGWEYSHRLVIGRESDNEMYAGLTDEDVEQDIEDRIFARMPDLKEWPYR